jgi:Flp pilus assembly protein TadG
MVEAALILPVFLLMLFAIMDFGRLLWAQHTVTQAACEAGRMAILNEPTNAEITTRIAEIIQTADVEGAPTITIGPRIPEQPASVSVSVGFRFMLIPGFVPGVDEFSTLQATSVNRHERG